MVEAEELKGFTVAEDAVHGAGEILLHIDKVACYTTGQRRSLCSAIELTVSFGNHLGNRVVVFFPTGKPVFHLDEEHMDSAERAEQVLDSPFAGDPALDDRFRRVLDEQVELGDCSGK